jgi:hypothetical protein
MRSGKQVYALRDAGLIARNASQVNLARTLAPMLKPASLVKALNQKGVKLSQIGRTASPALADSSFVTFDGSELRACPDAAAAIALARLSHLRHILGCRAGEFLLLSTGVWEKQAR